ncbi:MAG: Tetratricopeptide repeat protein [Methanocella sp. PtaU1.Bin125]|nr:MAG: Tetratricopeptide repeat protein [Methanocella sp. PtaU1.Bin125]
MSKKPKDRLAAKNEYPDSDADESYVDLENREGEVRLNPGDYKSRMRPGLAYNELEMYDLAIVEFEEAGRLRPKDSMPLGMLARVFHAMGYPEKSVELLKDAIRLNPESAIFRTMLGRCLEENGQIDKDIAQFKEAAKLAPDAPAPHAELAETYEAQGMAVEAREEKEIADRLLKDMEKESRRETGKRMSDEIEAMFRRRMTD